MSSSNPIDRRSVLRIGAGASLGLTAAPFLAACGDGAPPAKAEAHDSRLLPTTTLRSDGPRPDLPGTAAGVPQGFYRYPAQTVRATTGRPLAGADPVKVVMETYSPPAAARSRNAAYQAIEKLLGGTVDVTGVPADDYPTKFSTFVAGGDLPDVFMYPESGGVDNRAAFLDATCADLTPFLAGEKVKEYPNLAAIPQSAWQTVIFGGKLYGVPIARYGTGGAGVYRHDLFARAGVTDLDQITDLDRFVELCKALTRPDKDEYAISATVGNLVAMSAGAPQSWRVDPKTGKWQHQLETPEFEQAVEVQRTLYKAGCYYPGTLGMTGTQKAKYTDLFKNGKAAYVYDGMPGYMTASTGYYDAMRAVDPSYDPRPIRPFGPKAVVWTDNVALSVTHFRKSSPERVRQLLRLADFAASPFGSTEYTLINYGVEGTDFTRDKSGNPALTGKGTLDAAVPWKFIASGTPAVFMAAGKNPVDYVHEAYAEMVPMMIADPTLGYSSPTWDSKATGSLATLAGDGIKDIISGRKPVSSYKQLTRDYLAAGGEQARNEFEEAAQQGKKATSSKGAAK
ncbi:extracellular solute-binding protein [Actinacidiphila yeochonensis]|uniref:extracellular solute-binding protein n=1 Tax=Actinacidiphila yeochonensis TaxID=89050 RepID=UPI0005613297|nr:extracellular solute-binding protein [Actinacidiphila yeochonensis]